MLFNWYKKHSVSQETGRRLRLEHLLLRGSSCLSCPKSHRLLPGHRTLLT